MRVRTQCVPHVLLIVCALGSGLAAQTAAHATALVNDSRSHGSVGDGFLSLNETIRLHNQTLTVSQLSAAEAAPILGSGDINLVYIDAAKAPTVTFERDPDVITDQFHGFSLAGHNGIPVIAMGSTAGFVAASNDCDFARLHLRGGRTAITITQTDTIHGSLLEDLTVEGQALAGVRYYLPGAGNSRIQIDRCRFVQLPLAVAVHDLGPDRTGHVFMSDNSVVGGQQGIVFSLGLRGTLSVHLERNELGGVAEAVSFVREPGAGGRALDLEARHLRITGGMGGLALSGSDTLRCRLLVQSSELAGSRAALWLSPAGDGLDATFEDVRFAGPVALDAARLGSLTVANARLSAGMLALASSGSPLLVTDSILDGVATVLVGPNPARIEESRLIGGSLAGTAGAKLTVQRSHVAGTAVGGGVSVISPRVAPQLGSIDAAPLEPIVGGNLALHADLPASLTGLWFFGATSLYPTIGPRPFHFYLDLATLMVIPTPVRLQTTMNLPVPDHAALRGADLFFQMAVVPDLGFDAPPVSLPPGRRVVIR